MNEIVLKIEKLGHCAELPCYQSQGAAGMDLCAATAEDITFSSLERKLIPTGIKIELPQGYEAQIRPRSGMSIKHGISLVNCVGTIDEDYRGEVCVPLINLSKEPYTIKRGDRIAQMVISEVTKAQLLITAELTETSRATGGFGSTGY